jgi:hypothetical protein
MRAAANGPVNLYSESAFLDACKYGDSDLVSQILYDDCGCHFINRGFWIACERGHIKVVKILLRYGANGIPEGLEKACFSGHTDIVKLLIKRCSHKSLQMPDASGVSLLARCFEQACRGGHKDIIILFSEKLKVVHAAYLETEFGRNQYGSLYWNNRNPCLQEGLWIAISNGRVDVVEFLAEKARADAECYFDETTLIKAFILACLHNHPDIAKILFIFAIKNCIVFDKDKFLYHVCFNGFREVIPLLCSNGAILRQSLNPRFFGFEEIIELAETWPKSNFSLMLSPAKHKEYILRKLMPLELVHICLDFCK